MLLPNRFANEVARDPNANAVENFTMDFFRGWPGFDSITFLDNHEKLIVGVIREDLSRFSAQSIDLLVEEARTAFALPSDGEAIEWQECALLDTIGLGVAQLSSRIFLGPELCRNQDWLQMSLQYVLDLFMSVATLRASTPLLRPISYWFNPHCTSLRRHMREARRLIAPEIKQRMHDPMLEKRADTLSHMMMRAGGRQLDFAAGLLSLTFLGTVNLANNVSMAIIDICEHPEIVQALRDEMNEVLKVHGWTGDALSKMKFLDSFMKESQRMHPPSATTVARVVKEKIVLSDGTTLPKGSRCFAAWPYMDPALYPDSEKFDAYRFLRLSENVGKGGKWRYTDPSAEHMAWGLGKHACPGRFMAGNLTKIALCFLLLKYDWKLKDGPTFYAFDTFTSVNPQCRVLRRGRKSPVDL